MSALTVLNAAKTALASLGIPTYFADQLDTDADGRLQPPTDPAHFVLHAILRAPYHEWGDTHYGTTTVQVDAWSRTEGQPLALLASAEPLLTAVTFVPGRLRGLGRDGTYTGYAQDFERNA